MRGFILQSLEAFDSWNDFRKIRYLRYTLKTSNIQDTLVQELLVHERRLTYKYDFWLFILEVMNAESHGENAVPLAQIHKRLCRFLRCCKNRGLNAVVRLPRYHLKTQIATIYYRIWRLVYNPELCGIIVSGTLSLSKDTARAIRQELRTNTKLRQLYPAVLPDWLDNERHNKWSETEFNVARQGNYAQTTILAVGVDATVTGKHFGEISFDDIVTKENSTTPEQCEKVIKAYRFFLSIVNLKKRKNCIPILIVGTNYTDNDLYTFLESTEVRTSFCRFVQPVFDTAGEPIWKEQHTKESLETIRIQQGSYLFAGQYLLDPVPEIQQEFKRTWIQTFADFPLDINGQLAPLDRAIVVDPITMKKQTSTSKDRGVVLVGMWDKRKNIYIVDYALYARAKESQLFDAIFKFQDKYQINEVLWEAVAYQAQGAMNLEEVCKSNNRRIKVIQIHPGHSDKNVRIRSLIPHFERGQFFIKSWMIELIQELTRFPYGQKDDIVDVLAYLLRHVVGKQRVGLWKTNMHADQKPFYI